MQKNRINYARLPILLTLALATFAGSCPQTVTRQSFFPPFTARPNLIEPPQDQLLLWLEGNAPGGGSYMQADPSGAVGIWYDLRGGTRNIAAVAPFVGQPGGPRTGARITASITTPSGATYSAFALRCGNPTRADVRCCYLPSPTDVPVGSLDNTPYTILAVVRRTSGRGDNYFVMTNGRGCDANLGGIKKPLFS